MRSFFWWYFYQCHTTTTRLRWIATWVSNFQIIRYKTSLDLDPIPSEKDLEEGKARWYQWVLMLGALSRALQTKHSWGGRHSVDNPSR